MESTHVRDIVQLKLQKRLIEEKLSNYDKKMERLTEIVNKKKELNPFNTFMDTKTMSMDGLTVNDYRVPPRSTKVLPKIPLEKTAMAIPVPITNENILRIRRTHSLRTTGKIQINEKIKEKELEELKKVKKEKTLPDVHIPVSMLPNRYIRGELPCTIEHGKGGLYLSWACPLETLDYEYYLPLFFDGLQCSEYPITFISRQGIEDLLFASRGYPDRIKPVLHLLARPLRNALSKYEPDILLGVLKALQQLITCNEGVGEDLMRYSKQFLSPMSLFMDRAKNIGDRIDYGQRKNDDIGEEIRKVLELMEQHGGPKAYQLIKFSVPLYESCLKRPDAHHHIHK